MRFDSVIVGAGPAGCVAARELSQQGARVALVDGSHPREKACGGGVTFHALAALADPALTVRAGGHAIREAVFESDGRRARLALSADDLHVLPRRTLDAELLASAVAGGAVHVPARALSFVRTDYGWTVETTGGSVTGSWLLGADGAAGIVRKHTFRPFARDQLSVAAGCFVEGVSAPEIVIRFVDRPPGYLWSFPRHDHLAVGACAQANETSSAAVQAIADRWLDTYPPAAGHPRRRYGWPIPSLTAADLAAERPAGDRWLLLGDAAGLVDPITREGIFFAVRSGLLAAEALQRPDPSGAYTAAVRDGIHRELARASQLRNAFFQPRFTSLLVDALARSPAIAAVMIDLIAGRQSYAGLKRRLLGTWEIGLMIKLLVGW